MIIIPFIVTSDMIIMSVDVFLVAKSWLVQLQAVTKIEKYLVRTHKIICNLPLDDESLRARRRYEEACQLRED